MRTASEYLNTIRALNPDVEDPISDPGTLAQAVSVGLMDAPQLVNSTYAPGQVHTRSIGRVIPTVDPRGEAFMGTPRQHEVRVLPDEGSAFCAYSLRIHYRLLGYKLVVYG